MLRLLVCVVIGFLRIHNVDLAFTTKLIENQPLWNATYIDQLRQALLLGYDKFSRPAQHYNTTLVKLGLVATHIEINEVKSSITMYGWMQLNWVDEKLKWNSDEHGGVGVIRLAYHEVWQPDIFLYNSILATSATRFGTSSLCLVYANGDILWVPPTALTALCEVNLKYWPYDTQHCFFKFGSWTHSGDQIDLESFNNKTEVSLELVVNNTEWKLVKSSVAICSDTYEDTPYPYMLVEMTVKRQSPAYGCIIVTPAFVIVTFTLLSFWISAKGEGKIILNSVTCIIICLYLIYFTQKLPAMGNGTPLIVSFYSTSLYLSMFAIIESILVMWLVKTVHYRKMPVIIRRQLTGKLGKWLQLNAHRHECHLTHEIVEEMRDQELKDENNISEANHQTPSRLKKSAIHSDYVLLAAAIDRLCFWLYSLFFITLSLTHLL